MNINIDTRVQCYDGNLDARPAEPPDWEPTLGEFWHEMIDAYPTWGGFTTEIVVPLHTSGHALIAESPFTIFLKERT